jgi:hypothetical protein
MNIILAIVLSAVILVAAGDVQPVVVDVLPDTRPRKQG